MAERMILIPQDAVQRLQGDKTNITALDKEMTQILKSNKLNDAEKWKLYNQALQRFLHLTGTQRKDLEITIDPVKVPNIELNELLMSSIPKKYQSNAMLLYDILAPSKDISWSKSGEVTIKGKKIHNSHIIELVNDVLRHRKNIEPRGWQDFSKLLRDLNVGRDIIGNKNRYMPSQRGSGIVWHNFTFKK